MQGSNHIDLDKALKMLSDKDVLLREKENEIKKLQDENDRLQEKLKKLLQDRYGKKTEKLPDEELPVLDEAVVTEEEAAEIKAAEQEIKVAGYTRTKPKRKPLPANFLRETVIHDIPKENQFCTCGTPLHCIGEETSEKLDYIPAQIKVIKNVRKKYGCRRCEMGVVTAPVPSAFLPKSLAAPGLLAHVILSKYEDHLPLYRQEGIWQRLGVDIPRSTLCNWVLMAAERLAVLIPLLRDQIIQSQYARADETPVQVLEEKKVRTSKKAYMWVFTTGRIKNAVIIYQFAMSRHGEHATLFFKDFKGHLQADGYGGYNELANTPGVIYVACWSHARRKFVAIIKIAKKHGVSHYMVAIIAKLYKIEKEIKEKQFDVEQIKNHRQKYSKPILDDLKKWLESKQPQVPPKSPLGLAISYALDRWGPLTEYLNYGFLDIDNNFGERCVRPFTIGRKNWIFMGNERGGKAAAVFYSLIETAKANNLNTYAYFRYLMTELPRINIEDLNALVKLLPINLKSEAIEQYLK
jgi:transposase